MSPEELIRRVDEKACVDFLSAMVRHPSHSQTQGERKLAEFMVDNMRAIGLEAELTPVEGDASTPSADGAARAAERACCSTAMWTPTR